jgi:hypothetical protein
VQLVSIPIFIVAHGRKGAARAGRI